MRLPTHTIAYCTPSWVKRLAFDRLERTQTAYSYKNFRAGLVSESDGGMARGLVAVYSVDSFKARQTSGWLRTSMAMIKQPRQR